MKPITLTMTAFGPYKDKETVDFNDLKEHRLFVISGKTGAGKTTIFDGICFALYGQASGEDRTDTRALRSQFADDDVQTTVELTFDIHQRRYRVLRQIPYRKKGNKSETLGCCELFEESGTQSIPVTDRQIVTEVNEKIEELLGFTHAQFSQIMMLPQGEFRKFLTSDTANKEAIMRKIFKTEPYQKLADRLKVKKEEANAEYLHEKQMSGAVLHQIPAKLPERQTLLFTELKAEYPNYHQLITGLQEEQAYYLEQSVAKHEEYTKFYIQHDEKQKELHAASSVNEQFEKLKKRETELQQLHAQKETMAELERRWLAAERAARLEDLELQVKSNETELFKKNKSYEEAAALLADANRQLAAAKESYDTEQAREGERNALKEELSDLNRLLPAVSGLANERRYLEQLEKKANQASLQINQEQQKLEQRTASLELQKKEIKQLEAGLEDYESYVDELATVKAYAKQLQIFEQQSHKVKEIEQQFTEAKAENEHFAADYQALESQWIGSQAMLLAASLQEGEDCPVCGSSHHPNKAAGGENEHVTKQQLDQAKQMRLAKEQQFHSKHAELQQVLNQLEALDHELKEQQIVMGRDYKADAAALEMKVGQLRKNRETVKKKKEASEKEETAINELIAAMKKLELLYTETKSEWKTKLAVYNHSISKIPEEIQELPALQQKIQTKEAVSTALENAWNAIQQKLQDVHTLQTKMDSREQMEKQAASEMKIKFQVSRAGFEKRLMEEGFDSQESYLRVKLPIQERQNIYQRLQTYTQTLHTLKAALDELKESVKDKRPIDLHTLKQHVELLKNQYEQAFALFNQFEGWKKSAEELHVDLETSKKREAELEKNHGKITNLYDIVRGQNRLKISFERYIQIEYLERIIQAANIRLRDVSNGQYELIRSDRQETRGKQSGLGIDVHDAYTGQTRDVKTLSGGEKFNASLCLALGMADVIQSFQGAVRIETMFIDEGFGALDEEAIQKAIDTLIALQQSGRMIGIISHIDEMKEAIPATLQVTKMKEGYSKTKFVIK
ncbi:MULTISPECIES: AAA family ATPase [unclassified Sporosarcina]|uniref:AAA family ATPase n=1 Tax=unclassified Sporosarcina TaxID=2647733 RepID=UPI00203D77E5|nr:MULTISPECIES: AAA family ATPase [unclassified Sporosarcina]GKV64749.1 nuclease SbcCD subunit C [Sporosarcina sp. NCCP-2331]GLB54859.1 nuclease SbcCD subunit C [Sporosarcina sp. NCCP-2378]